MVALGLVERTAVLAEQILPLDRTRLAEFRAWEAAGELGEKDTRRRQRWDLQRSLHRRLVAELARTPAPDPARAHPDPWVEEWSEHLHTYVDGLASQLVLAPFATGPEHARRRLRAFLGRIADAHRTRASCPDPTSVSEVSGTGGTVANDNTGEGAS